MSKLPSQEKMSPSLRKALTGKPRMVRVDSSAAKTLIELTPEKLEDFERSLNRAEPVGTLLAQARKAKGFNQRQAAQVLNRNHSRIAALEHPKPETASKFGAERGSTWVQGQFETRGSKGWEDV
jgi:ribosome-binding protein aMBF1 (putative translation factor)